MNREAPPLEMTSLHADRLEGLRRLLAEPELSAQFELLARDNGLEDEISDPRLKRHLSRIARLNGEDVAFAFVFVLPKAGSDREWSMVWLGVSERFRRQGIASALLHEVLEGLADPSLPTPIEEVSSGYWEPNPAAEAFLEHHLFREARRFWLMDRALGNPPPAEWPEGVEVRVFDGSDGAFGDLNTVYNESFAGHWRFVPSTVEDCRVLAGMSLFDPKGVLLAYRAGRCVGFCRSALLGAAGEVAMLGVVPEARGIGLGRALLRAGVRWLEDKAAPRVTLRVDGENEGALALYRQEGFEITRTRIIWQRPLAG